MARKRGNKWQGDVKIGSKRFRKAFDNERAAVAWETQMQAADANGLTPEQVETEGTLAGFLDAHFETLWGDGKSVRHMQVMKTVIVSELGADTMLSELTPRRIAMFVSVLKQKGNANATINRKLSFLSKLLKFAHRLQVISEVPVIDKLRESQGRTRFLSRDEEAQALGTLKAWGLDLTHDLVAFLLYTGCRRGEALKLTWRDITDALTRATFWDTKSGEARTVPLVGPAKEAVLTRAALVQHRPNPNAKVFDIPPKTLHGHWERLRTHMGLEDDPQFVLHMLRHTCASRMVQGGVDLRRIQQWMGHKSIQTTLRYAHLAPKDLDVAAAALTA